MQRLSLSAAPLRNVRACVRGMRPYVFLVFIFNTHARPTVESAAHRAAVRLQSKPEAKRTMSRKQDQSPKPVRRSKQAPPGRNRRRTRRRNPVDNEDNGENWPVEEIHNHCDEAGVICAAVSMVRRSEGGGWASSKTAFSLPRVNLAQTHRPEDASGCVLHRTSCSEPNGRIVEELCRRNEFPKGRV